MGMAEKTAIPTTEELQQLFRELSSRLGVDLSKAKKYAEIICGLSLDIPDELRDSVLSATLDSIMSFMPRLMEKCGTGAKLLLGLRDLNINGRGLLMCDVVLMGLDEEHRTAVLMVEAEMADGSHLSVTGLIAGRRLVAERVITYLEGSPKRDFVEAEIRNNMTLRDLLAEIVPKSASGEESCCT